MNKTKMTYKNEIGEGIELPLRNVEEKNPKAAIQIEIITTRLSGRQYHTSLTVPQNRVEQFLVAIQPNLKRKKIKTKEAYEILTKAIHTRREKLLKKSLYESSEEEPHYIRALQNIGVWLDIVC